MNENANENHAVLNGVKGVREKVKNKQINE